MIAVSSLDPTAVSPFLLGAVWRRGRLGLPVRLMRERGFAVVTLGSKVERRAARWQELEAACAYVGFGMVMPDRGGLEGGSTLRHAIGNPHMGHRG